MVKDNLFVLIKSLSKSEKRQFKLYIGRLGANENAKFINLFGVLEKMTRYDEDEILHKKIVTKQQLSNLKAHLYKQILASLRTNPVHKGIRLQLREQLDYATILYNKGLYPQSLKLLERAKTMALKFDEKLIAYEIVELEKVIESQYITRSLTNRTEQLVTQADSLRHQNQIASQLSNLSLQLYEQLIKTGYTKNDDEYRRITQFFYKNLPVVQLDQLGFRERLWYFKAHVWYSFLTQDFLSCYRYAAKWVNLFHKHPEMIEVHPVFYLKGNNYLMESLTLLKHPGKFQKVLRALDENANRYEFDKNVNLATLLFLYRLNNQLNFLFSTGEFESGKRLIPEVLAGIDNYKDRIDPHHIMVLYYKVACLYFGLMDYEKCIFYLKKIIQNRSLKMREDLLCFSRVLNVFAHYEAGFDYHMDALLRDTYKFLIKMDEMYEVQKAMIRFLRSLGDIYPHELKGAFQKLHKELKGYENDPYERRAFLYLDVLSWLESKLQNRPVHEIIKEKAQNSNRKLRQTI